MSQNTFYASILLLNRSLAITELETIFNTTCKPVSGRWVKFETSENADSIAEKAQSLGMTQAIYSHVHTTTKDDYVLETARHINNTYRIDVKTTRQQQPDTTSITDAIYRACKQPLVDLHDPDHHYCLLLTEKNVHLLETLISIRQDFASRRSHRLIHNHPTSLNPRYSRAMINISEASTILDPFCGAGGILIEASKLAKTVNGGDFSTEMIARARSNLKLFEAKARLETKDARDWTDPVDAIVTDLPYGKNSLLSEDLHTLYTTFLEHAKTITATLVLGYKKGSGLEQIAQDAGWTMLKTFEIYVHKSMTRTISLFERNG